MNIYVMSTSPLLTRFNIYISNLWKRFLFTLLPREQKQTPFGICILYIFFTYRHHTDCTIMLGLVSDWQIAHAKTPPKKASLTSHFTCDVNHTGSAYGILVNQCLCVFSGSDSIPTFISSLSMCPLSTETLRLENSHKE